MNVKNLDLVAWSLARIRALAHAPAKVFLSRLAELDPTLLPLFGNIGTHDRRALARVHVLASAGFRNEAAPALLRDLAQRCRQRKIGYRDQAVIMSAALWTLQHLLGTSFTRADREAWIAYQQHLLLALERAARVMSSRPRGLHPN
ncbi:MAG: hypothetical protein ABW205_13510 [Burkholderiales bacterium]|jgi:hypothetical protein